MQQIIKFLVENWRIILEGVILVVSTVIFIIKKKPIKMVDEIKTHILRSLIYLVQKAEQVYGSGNGPEKREYVLDNLFETLQKCYPGADITGYYNFAVQYLEYILETPQKKGE